MDDFAAKAVAISILLFIGYLLKVLLEKLDINIKHPRILFFTLSTVGVVLFFFGP